MDTVFVVSVGFPSLDAVDDDLNVYGYDVFEISGLYFSLEKADRKAKELRAYYDQVEKKLGCDPVDICVTEMEVQ